MMKRFMRHSILLDGSLLFIRGDVLRPTGREAQKHETERGNGIAAGTRGDAPRHAGGRGDVREEEHPTQGGETELDTLVENA